MIYKPPGNLKCQSNGHSSRSYNALPEPGFTNIEFIVNDRKLIAKEKNIISDLDNGILIDQFLGAGQSNVIGGEFSANIELGYLIKDGKIMGRIKDSMVTGNFFDFFNNIIKVSAEKYLISRFHIPGVLFEKISVVPK